jgi:hypothetical protein
VLLGTSPEDYDKHFKLIADVDLSGYSYDAAIIAPDLDRFDLAFQGASFSGILDGSGHIISNLTISGEHYLGLFGRLEYGAQIKNLGIIDVNITGSDYIGGFVGFSKGSIATSYCAGMVNGNRFVGGLTGRNWDSITASYNTAAITGNNDVGGLAAGNYGSINNCYNTGTVTANWDAGGLVGVNSGGISTSYSTGTISGENRAGGLVGYNLPDFGIVSGFWDVESSGLTSSDGGGIGETTDEMQTINTFIEAGWDFVGETTNGTENIWWIDEGRDYPRLWWELRDKYGGGTGELNDPYQIYTAEQMDTVGTEPGDWNKHFRLKANIDMSGYSYDRALIAPDTNDIDSGFQGISFTGVFDGNNHAISNLSIVGENYVGLFGQLETGAEIKNLGIVNVNITGNDYVGGLAGFNKGSITMSYCTGVVSGEIRVGGLVGRNWCSIIECYSIAAVTGNNDVGGLAANNYGSIANSYNAGTVTVVNMDAGGLVGVNYGNISMSYNTGLVVGNNRVGGLVGFNWPDTGIVSGFWDVEASGQSASDGGVAKTTAEMKTASTFLETGWDFVDETENGTEDIWWIDEGWDYPQLWWELN